MRTSLNFYVSLIWCERLKFYWGPMCTVFSIGFFFQLINDWSNGSHGSQCAYHNSALHFQLDFMTSGMDLLCVVLQEKLNPLQKCWPQVSHGAVAGFIWNFVMKSWLFIEAPWSVRWGFFFSFYAFSSNKKWYLIWLWDGGSVWNLTELHILDRLSSALLLLHIAVCLDPACAL